MALFGSGLLTQQCDVALLCPPNQCPELLDLFGHALRLAILLVKFSPVDLVAQVAPDQLRIGRVHRPVVVERVDSDAQVWGNPVIERVPTHHRYPQPVIGLSIGKDTLGS